MPKFKYLSIIKYKEEPPGNHSEKQMVLKKERKSGSNIFLPKDGNDIEDMVSVDWERIALIDISGFGFPKMDRDEFMEWWNERKDRPEDYPIIRGILGLMGEGSNDD